MSFGNASFLYSLFLVLLPLIIHFFSMRRRRTVSFSNVAMLREVRTATTTTKNIKHWLILVSRMLFIAALVLAFSNPYLPIKNTLPQGTVTAVVLDNHWGMGRHNGQMAMIDQMKQLAFEVAAIAPPNQRFVLTAQHVSTRNALVKEKYQDKVNAVDASFLNTSLDALIERALVNESLEASPEEVFVLSDFRQGSFLPANWAADSQRIFHLLPIARGPGANLSVDTCFFSQPVRHTNGEEKMRVRVSNASDQKLSAVVSLFINDKRAGLLTIEIPAHQSKEGEIVFEAPGAGFISGRVELQDGADMHDNVLYFSYEVAASVDVLAIYGIDSSRIFRTLYSGIDGVNFSHRSAKDLNPEDIEGNDIIILYNLEEVPLGLTESLKERLNYEGVFSFFPPNGDVENINALLAGLALPQYGKADSIDLFLNSLNIEDPFFDDVFEQPSKDIKFPEIAFSHPLLLVDGNNVSLISGAANRNLLSRSSAGAMQALLWSVPIGLNSLENHALFVVVMTRLLFDRPDMRPLYFEPGQLVPVSNRLQARQNQNVRVQNGIRSFVPEILSGNTSPRLRLHDQGKVPGIYQVYSNDSVVMSFALNAKRSKSNSFLDAAQLKLLVEQSGAKNIDVLDVGDSSQLGQVLSQQQNKALWVWFILAAIAFLAFEIFFIQFWKR
jgi:hypothetical protein